LELRDDAVSSPEVALFAGDQHADLLAHDPVDNLRLLWGAVRGVAEQAVEHRLQPAGHAVEIQRHREDDAVGGQYALDEQLLVAVVQRAAAVLDSAAATAVAQQAFDELVEEDVFNVVARGTGSFDRRTSKYMRVAVLTRAGADYKCLHVRVQPAVRLICF
jgi:hypothetical protein